jgi:viroplasmin and RNaseH domain-containing protein
MGKSKPKFYAVRIGRTPGIYHTWAECEAQVKGHPGAKFKGFVVEVDAQSFINNAVSSIDGGAGPSSVQHAARAAEPPAKRRKKEEHRAPPSSNKGLTLYFDGG